MFGYICLRFGTRVPTFGIALKPSLLQYTVLSLKIHINVGNYRNISGVVHSNRLTWPIAQSAEM